MRRSQATKPSSKSPSSTTSGASKIKEMQKAYGVTSKASSSTNSKPVQSERLVGNSSTFNKSRNSVGAGGSGGHVSNSSGISTGTTASTVKKSFTSDTSTKSSSKILATSKANYAEKYGSSGLSQKGTKVTSIGNSTTSSNNASHRKSNSNNNNNSPYGNSPKQISNSSKSNASTVSRLTTQQPPQPLYESEATEDYGDEDFEEDYESDFEEANSTDEEASGADIKSRQSQNDVSLECDKSSSIREFEQLEKMVEVEEQEQQRNSVTLVGNTNGYSDIQGGKVNSRQRPNETEKNSNNEDDDDDDEDDEVDTSEESLTPKKQNAFPTTPGGFSISSSAQQRDQHYLQQSEKNAVVRQRHQNEGSSDVAKTAGRGPEKESGAKRRNRTNRGKIIQGMIKLDRVGVDIFHLQPYPYERLMTVFSGADRLQTSTQTDQDKSVESVQTDPIDQITKWTQKPPTWSTTSSSCDIRIVRQEALGVGSDEITEELSQDQKIYKQFDFIKNWEQLSKFIVRASRKMLYVLETEERIKLPSTSGKKGSLETVKMNRGLSVLNKLEMHTLTGDGEFVGCANGTPIQYQQQNNDSVTNGNKKHTSKNLITVWSLKEPSMPFYFLRVWGHVSALRIHMIARMILSGNRDGSINIWNLDEPLCYHSQYQEHVIRTPSVNTSCMVPAHVSPIIGIDMFSDSKNTFTMVSTDKEGLILTWSCVRSHDTIGDSVASQYSSAWSTIHISVRHQIRLGEINRDHIELTCFSAFYDMEEATTGFYFGTFNGYVAKGNMIVESGGGDGSSKYTNVSATIEKYQERVDSNPKITCMDISKTLNILAMGCEDGRCRLFELSRKKLVLSLGGKQEEGPIRVRWSGRRASVLYVASRDSLLIWDLLSSDMNPWKTIHVKNIRDFVLYSPSHKEYLVIISGNEMIISTPAEEVKPLTSRDFTRIRSYFSLLC